MTSDPNEILKLIRSSKSTLPGRRDLAEALVNEFGGVVKLASEIKQQYTKAKKNPAAASRMLADIMHLLVNSQDEDDEATERMSDEELLKVLREALGATTNEARPPADEPAGAQPSVPA
jgi:hypothetical protein